MLEIWKSVLDYEGLYEVSNLGRVRSWINNRGNKRKEPLIMSGNDDGQGYLKVRLRKDKKNKDFRIHRLVAEAFILGRKMKKDEVCDHINTIRHDNRLENLRVCTCKQNMNNPLTRERCSESMVGKTNRAIPLTLRGVKDGSIYNFNSSVEASRFFDYRNKTHILSNISRARKAGKRTIKLRGEEFYFSQAVK